ncbi:MAG TPA: NfeD family protein [Pyrinomonadaceae bacterium]|jgi:membrane-bound ClpP family serine protease
MTMILFISLLSIGAVGLILFLFLHKHSSNSKSPVSSLATVHTALSPNGSVFVDGELWLAESLDGNLIREKRKVMVIGLRDHLLLVRPVSDEL